MEPVLAVIPACVTSPAVTVALPAVSNVTPNVCVPPLNAALVGKIALLSLDVIATVSLVLIKFQLASTALAVTLNTVPTVCAAGVPALPLALPGAAVSPGISN